MNIVGSVGLGGKNQRDDVKKVQQLLKKSGFPLLQDDGLIGPKTLQAIRDYQSRFMAHPDGRVDADSRTLRALTLDAVAVSHEDVKPAPAAVQPVQSHASSDVIAGQVTFDAEGKDDPKSLYFSRHIHWPGNANSGVTIGRGYDLGERTETSVCHHMMQSGIPEAQAGLIAKGAGKKGEQANLFVKNNRSAIGLISHQHQINLFNLVYPDYIKRARGNYERWTAVCSERTLWDDLQPVIRDIMVDFVYQGFTKGEAPMKAGMTNDIDRLISYILHSETMISYEAGRNRIGYLKKYR